LISARNGRNDVQARHTRTDNVGKLGARPWNNVPIIRPARSVGHAHAAARCVRVLHVGDARGWRGDAGTPIA
jgi:hypothetical protein